MPGHRQAMMAIAAIAFAAAVVNGALGYGFSTLAVPLGLLMVSNRDLAPAIVLLEVAMNAYVLWSNRGSLRRTWRLAAVITVGLPLGIAVGTAALVRVDADWLKLATFAALLPLILCQVAGFRRPIRSERAAGFVLGSGVGLLYAVTTISGPPLALFLTNQGHAQQDFRAALGVIRFAAASLALLLYTQSGLITHTSLTLVLTMLPAMLLGIPIGARLVRRLPEDSFRRVCMGIVALIVAFGLSTLLRSLARVPATVAFAPLLLVAAFTAIALGLHFRAESRELVSCRQGQAS